MKNMHSLSTGEWTAQVSEENQKAVREWDSFTFTKIDDKHAVVIAGVQEGFGAVNCVHCLQLNESDTTGDLEWVCHNDIIDISVMIILKWLKCCGSYVTEVNSIPEVILPHSSYLHSIIRFPTMVSDFLTC